MKHDITLKVNGYLYELSISPNQTLLDVLRDKLGLMGTKKSCDLGVCGACTVLLDGQTCLSCLLLAVDAAGKEIVTIEGLAAGEKLHPIQEAFVEAGAIQCGFCTPGMILVAKAFLERNPHPTEEETRRAISGNLCRCTGYSQIIEAVLNAAEKMRK
jgi:carbon-monoxide dehydrogenase small subunit